MAADTVQDGGSARKKITMGILAVVLLFILYEAYGLISNKSPSSTTTTSPTVSNNGMKGDSPNPTKAAAMMPKQEPLPKTQPMTQREADLMRAQQETEAKYVAALNELQMLKIEKEIADTNKAIMSAKFDTITAEKNIVNSLTAPAPTVENYAQNLGGAPVKTTTQGPATTAPIITETYSVISITRINNKWSAVLGYKGKLYSVSVGDVLPADGARVISINRSNVVLEKEGEKTTISLVPII